MLLLTVSGAYLLGGYLYMHVSKGLYSCVGTGWVILAFALQSRV